MGATWVPLRANQGRNAFGEALPTDMRKSLLRIGMSQNQENLQLFYRHAQVIYP